MEKINIQPVKNYGIKATVAQTLATVAQSFLLIGLGMELTVSTLVIGDLRSSSPQSGFSMTQNEASWYGSILFIFHPIGSVMSGFLQERFGRKRCMILANVPSILGWILLYYTNSITMLYVSTISMGMSIGFSEAPIISYVGEVTEPRLRGSMASIASMSSMIGMLLISILGSMYHWRIVALLSIISPVACMCFIACIPESPMWLIAKGRNEEAEKCLCWLRGWVEPNVVKSEFHELIHYNEVSGALQGDSTSRKSSSILQYLALFKDPLVYRPLRLVMLFFFFSFILCLIPCRPFLYIILERVGIFDYHDLILVLLSVLQIMACIITILTVNRLGKRFLTLFSFATNTFLLFAFGGYLIALNNNLISSTRWIPLLIISSIFFFGAYGLSSMPWILLSEIYSNESRGVATGVSAALSYLLIFILTKSYLPVESLLTLEYSIILFAVIGVFGALYSYYYLPETENKTFLEIEEFFALNKRVH
ncbi:facilitated trehalose transporter Tret1-like isoform X2 [Daktulosphaira vitifoliae]|nr:facilitated trehalose transporter Tret1-like isoform X2 [Daktulosphaira vitifoliae]